MKTLVTFLGRGRENKETGYRPTTYEFPDGSQTTTAFFGPAIGKTHQSRSHRYFRALKAVNGEF